MFFKWLDKLIERKVKREMAKQNGQPVWFSTPKTKPLAKKHRRTQTGLTRGLIVEHLKTGNYTSKQMAKSLGITEHAARCACNRLKN